VSGQGFGAEIQTHTQIHHNADVGIRQGKPFKMRIEPRGDCRTKSRAEVGAQGIIVHEVEACCRCRQGVGEREVDA
jgi:hypothetical protein